MASQGAKQTSNIAEPLSQIDAIYLSGSFCELVDVQSCDCDAMVLQNGDSYVYVTCRSTGEACDLVMQTKKSLDETNYPYQAELAGVHPVFDGEIFTEDQQLEGIRFRLGKGYLFVFADRHNLILTKSICDLFAEDVIQPMMQDVELRIIYREKL